jgi:RNA polymerase sigma-70 factor, ECF subfamily
VSSAEEARQFEEVVLCHFDLVYRLALKLTHDQHEAEDLVQETFLKAHRAFAGFELRGYGAKPWLLKILHNVYLTRRGKAGRSPTLMDDLSLDDIAAELEREPLPGFGPEPMNWEQFDDELKAAVQALSPDYRSVLLLWALGDLSYKEIADVLGCAVGTVMSRLFRARHQLGESLADYATKRNIRPRGPGGLGAN